MSPTLELDLERATGEAVRETLRHWLTYADKPDADLVSLAGEFGPLVRSHVGKRCDFRESMLAAVRRVAEDTPREHIDTINDFYQQVTDLHIAGCELLLSIAGKLEAKGLTVEGVDELREAIADYRRWKDDLPDELLLRHGPVRRRLAAAVQEGLRNPPAASDWHELFDD
ncbi:MAG: hypothetical protein HYS12_12990 [Planctomycetes bacterium]|nr:hypothetical protein [Planctomycetota bacterium]